MYTKLTGEFDCIEFAEAAAKMIRDSIAGEKKIILYKNKSKYRGCAESITDNNVANGNSVLIYPFSTHSNNFISGLVTRSADESQINELLRTESVKMEVICLENASDKAAQYMLSCGGYDLKS
ncbi:MAG: hypothetical protein NC320_02750 [Clostridium sp.]|nr:hypothetical protein [Clostridium sp.]MCM1547026.1 hypothetical protein [Ruminococcus sp.]